jgi:hypothetical protein
MTCIARSFRAALGGAGESEMLSYVLPARAQQTVVPGRTEVKLLAGHAAPANTDPAHERRLG